MENSPPKKNRKGKVVHSGQRVLIINCYKDKKTKHPDMKYEELMESIAYKYGVGKRLVVETVAAYKKTGEVESPPKKRLKPDAVSKLLTEDLEKIRNHVHDFWRRKELPTVQKVLVAINDDNSLPKFSRTTLQRILKSLKFKYIKRKRNSVLIEEEYLIRWRQTYISKIRKFRAEGRPIYFLDETWVNVGDTKQTVWVDQSVESTSDVLSKGLTIGAAAPVSKGKRLIVLHMGSEEGFLQNGLLCFESKKNSSDYHDQMNAKTFYDYIVEVLPNLKDKAVIVMDNAPYHSAKLEKCPTKMWNKEKIREWLASKNITISPDAMKYELLDKVAEIKPLYDKYIIDEYVKAFGKDILRLPPYHCDLNPIDLAWSSIKNYVKSNNKTFKLIDVKKLLIEGVKKVTPEMWQNFISHAIKNEDKLYDIDHIIDNIQDVEDTSFESQNSSNEDDPQQMSDTD